MEPRSPQTLLRQVRAGVSATTAAAVLCAALTACAGGISTRTSRIGVDDGTDPCRREAVALDSSGDFFTEDILKGAVIGMLGGAAVGGIAGQGWRGALLGAGAGAAVGAATGYWAALQRQGREQEELLDRVRRDLTRENAEIDRIQIAYDALADCRFRKAQSIRTAYAQRQIPREAAVAQMEQVRTQAQRDIQLARLISGKIAERGVQLEIAAENLSPGTQRAIEHSRSVQLRPAVVHTSTPLKLRPADSSVDVASLRGNERVRVIAIPGRHAVVETDRGERGYVPLSVLDGMAPDAGQSMASDGAIRTLAGSNAARRDDFAASVAVTEQATARQLTLED